MGYSVEDLVERIDFANVSPNVIVKEIETFCKQAVKYGFRQVYVSSSYLPLARKLLKGEKIELGCPINFPYGNGNTSAKLQELNEAIENGVKWIDPVMNIGMFKSKDYKYVENEMKQIIDLAHKNSVKVKTIIETGYLTDNEIIKASKMLDRLNTDFIKTCTSMGSRGVTLNDILLIKKSINGTTKIKAAGKVQTLDEVMNYLNVGAHRVGTSVATQIIDEAIEREKKRTL